MLRTCLAIGFCGCLFGWLPALAQEERCGTVQYGAQVAPEAFEQWLQGRIREVARKNSRGPEAVMVVPVVVHLIHNGENVGSGPNLTAAQVASQITVLNRDYRRLNADRLLTPPMFEGVAADMRIEFRLAELDTLGNRLPEPGINRYNGRRASWTATDFDRDIKPVTSWDPKRYFNIWVAPLGGSSLGYASWPKQSGLQGVPFENDTERQDGVVINFRTFGANLPGGPTFASLTDSRYAQGRTTTHEIGHFFGILHPWGIVGTCGQDDFCGDTPTTSRNRDDVEAPCAFPDPVEPNSCVDAGNDLPDMFQNFMDYTPDACMNLFTLDQKFRARAVLSFSPNRKELPNSQVIRPTFAPSQVQVTRTAGSGYTVRWLDNTFNESAFEVERATSPTGSFTLVSQVAADLDSLVDDPGIGTFFYRVRAVNAAGASAYSQPQSTPELALPAPPTNLQAQAPSQDSIRLTWTIPGGTFTGFQVEMAEGNGEFTALDQDFLPPTTSSIGVTPLRHSTVYRFRLATLNGAGLSAYSNEATATTLPYPPAAPEEAAVAYEQAPKRFRVSWLDMSDNETGFIIERSTEKLTGYQIVGTASAGQIDWLDSNYPVPRLAKVYYRIFALNAGGRSTTSNLAFFDALTGETGSEALEDIAIYPNPTATDTWVEIARPGRYWLSVDDLVGRNMLSTSIVGGTSPTHIGTAGWPKGMYVLQVIGEGVVFSKKIAVE